MTAKYIPVFSKMRPTAVFQAQLKVGDEIYFDDVLLWGTWGGEDFAGAHIEGAEEFRWARDPRGIRHSPSSTTYVEGCETFSLWYNNVDVPFKRA